MGFNNQFSYGAFTVGVLVDWRYGGIFVSRTKALGSTSGVLEETLEGREGGIVGDGVMNIGTDANPQYVPNDVNVQASSYYNAFVKFGRFMMHINPLYPEKYIDYVILSKIKLDHWARDDLYEAYLVETLKSEPVESALQRSIATMMDWAAEQHAQWADYFRLVNTNRAVQHIQQGKISPWMLLGCKAGKNLLQSFNDEQLQMTAKFINPGFWVQKIKSAPADQLFVQETAKEAKIE